MSGEGIGTTLSIVLAYFAVGGGALYILLTAEEFSDRSSAHSARFVSQVRRALGPLRFLVHQLGLSRTYRVMHAWFCRLCALAMLLGAAQGVATEVPRALRQLHGGP